jgi:hypothetical protein
MASNATNEYPVPANSNKYAHSPIANSSPKKSINFFNYESYSEYNEIILYTLLFLGLNSSFIIDNLSKIKNLHSNTNLLLRTAIFGTILYIVYTKKLLV